MSCADAFKVVGVGAQAAGAVGSAYSSYKSSEGTKQGYEYQAAVARGNATLANWQADDAMLRGTREQNKVQLSGAQLEGKQRAIFGSRNIDVNEGSALNILADTRFMQKRDEATVIDNTAKDAWALRSQAGNYSSNADFLRSRASAESPVMNALGTALTSGGKVASQWYSLRSDGLGKKGSSIDYYNIDT